MATKKVNKLNSSILASIYAKQFTQKKIIIDIDNKEYEVLLDEKFSTVKLQKLMYEFMDNYNYLKDTNHAVKVNYYTFLIIKYFSDIDVAKTDKFEEQIKILNYLIDLDIYEKVTNAFGQEEITKAFSFIKKFTAIFEQFLNENKDLDEIKDIMKNEINTSENIN